MPLIFIFDAEPDCPFFRCAFHSTRCLIPGMGVSFLFSFNIALIFMFSMSNVFMLILTCSRYAVPSMHSFIQKQILSWLRVERQAGFAPDSVTGDLLNNMQLFEDGVNQIMYSDFYFYFFEKSVAGLIVED